MASKTPKVVYLLVENKKEGSDAKTYFNRAGVAFENRDGSLNLRLDMFPSLTFQVREPKDNDDRQGG